MTLAIPLPRSIHRRNSPPSPVLPTMEAGVVQTHLLSILVSFLLSLASTSRDLHPLGMPDSAGFAPFGFPLGETVPGDSLGVGL